MISLVSSDPTKLLTTFKKLIDDKKVVTWSYDKDGDFSHTPEQWKEFGWLRPSVGNGQLTLRFLGKQNKTTTWEAWAVYHGRFVESMMAHCNTLYTEASVPPKPSNQDTVTQAA